MILAGCGFVTAGPLGAALAVSIPGALVGGLVGGLVGFGFPDESAKAYEQAMKDGAVALGVTFKKPDHLTLIQEKFRTWNAKHIILV